jgi:hypothetical protein
MAKSKLFPDTIISDGSSVYLETDIAGDPEAYDQITVAEYKLYRRGRLVLTPAKVVFEEEAK